MTQGNASVIRAADHGNGLFHRSGCLPHNEGIRKGRSIIGISQECPPILFCKSEFMFFYRIIGNIDDTRPDVLFAKLKRMAIGHKENATLTGKILERECIFGFDVPVKQRQLCRIVCHQEGMCMVGHQTERKSPNSSFSCFYGIDRIIDQTIYLAIKQYVPVKSFLIAMCRDSGFKEVFHTHHIIYFQR